MFSDFEIAGFTAIVVAAIVSFVIALIMGSKWEQENPLKLGFKWGYFFIFSTLFGNGLLLGAFFVIAAREQEFGFYLLSLAITVILFIFVANALKRRKWALVLLTLLSFNGLWMIINVAYLRNRWGEFGAERAERLPRNRDKRARVVGSLSTQWRLAIFAAASWVLAVLIFVVLFEPYGRYFPPRDDDFIHMLAVTFLPSGSGLGLYFIYGRFVR